MNLGELYISATSFMLSLFTYHQELCRVVDFARASGMSLGKQVKLFVQGLTKAASNRGSSKFTSDELERFAKDMRLQLTSFQEFLEVCNSSGNTTPWQC